MEYAEALKAARLDTFEAIWQHEIDWFEAPNQCRGGWSGVGKLALQSGDGELVLFVKKQENHGRRSWRHPVRGEPTFRRERQRLKFLAQRQIAAPQVVFYGERVVGGRQQAILVTKALGDYYPLDEVTNQWFGAMPASIAQQQTLVIAVAQALRKLHATGLSHRAMYPKHIFVKHADSAPQVAFIDMEKSRFSPFLWHRCYSDLSSLQRRSLHWPVEVRTMFYHQYWQTQQLSLGQRLLGWLILRRAAR